MKMKVRSLEVLELKKKSVFILNNIKKKSKENSTWEEKMSYRLTNRIDYLNKILKVEETLDTSKKEMKKKDQLNFSKILCLEGLLDDFLTPEEIFDMDKEKNIINKRWNKALEKEVNVMRARDKKDIRKDILAYKMTRMPEE